MRRLFRLVVLVALGVWVWRFFTGHGRPQERVTVAYADGSALVLEPSSPGFERLTAIARAVETP